MSLAEHSKEVGRLEEDRQHFVNALAESMNEVTRLRNMSFDYGEGEYDEDWYGKGEEHDGLEQRYRTAAGHPDAARVGPLDYGDRVRRVVAPLTGPQTKPDASFEPTDFLSAARKAAQAAAAAANEHNQNNKAYKTKHRAFIIPAMR